MAAEERKIPVLAVVGPTASGKTALAVQLAHVFGGEVVGADSMQIYQGMEIATAAPSEQEREGVPHHLIGFARPEERFSVASYTALARRCIGEIWARGRLPVVAGGTGLYIDALLEHIEFSGAPADPAVQAALYRRAEKEGAQSLWQELSRIDPDSAASLHPGNLGRIVRALELFETSGLTMSEQRRRSRQTPSPYCPFYLGLDFHDRQLLYDRIDRRVSQMAENGLLEEARRFLSLDPKGTGAQAIGYKELKPYFAGELTLEQALDNLRRATRRYAKRQLTWFRRNKQIHWIFWEDYETPSALFGEACRLVRESDWGQKQG